MKAAFLWLGIWLVTAASAWVQAAPQTPDAKQEKLERDLRMQEIIQALGLVKGAKVADIGAGEGDYEPALSRAVGTDGRVYAEDIGPTALKRLRERVKEGGLGNVEVIEGAADDPKLPRNLDAVLMVIMYHEVAEPAKMLDHAAAALRPNGRFVMVEMTPHKTLTRPRADQVKNHVLAPDIAEAEVRRTGFEVVSRDDHFIDRPDEESTRWIIVFQKLNGPGAVQ